MWTGRGVEVKNKSGKKYIKKKKKTKQNNEYIRGMSKIINEWKECDKRRHKNENTCGMSKKIN